MAAPSASSVSTVDTALQHEPERQRWAHFAREQLLELVHYQGDLLQALLTVLLARSGPAAVPGESSDAHAATLTVLKRHLERVRALASHSGDRAAPLDLDHLLGHTRQLLRAIEAERATAEAERATAAAEPDTVSSPAQPRPDRRFRELSTREREVLDRLLAGQSSVEIGLALGVADTTVRTYRSRVMRKLEVTNFADLIKRALGHELTTS